MEKAYKYRLYPNKAQEDVLQKTFGSCRFVYNHYLAKRIEAYKEDKSTLNYNACSADLTQLKKELTWLKEVDSTALQTSLKDLDTAYTNFFKRVKKGNAKVGFPKFKSKKLSKKSYTAKMGVKVTDKAVQLPKLGLVKCVVSRPIEGRVLSATIAQSASGKYYVSVLCTDVQAEPKQSTGALVGIDLGLKAFAVTSDGEVFENPKYLAKSQKKLAKLQRQLSRKTKGGCNRNKARIQVAKLHEHITNQRTDFIHKLSTCLVRDYDFIAVEDLQVKNMVRNHKLAKAIIDVAWGEFVRQLEYKSVWYEKYTQRIDKFYPSSQLCSECGYKNPAVKDLAVREWVCPECGVKHDRDENAATNILNEGLRLVS